MSLTLPPPEDLKGRVEYALAREYYKVPALRVVTPQLWRSNARKKAITLSIQAASIGDEESPGLGIYRFGVSVSVQARAGDNKPNPSKYIAEVEKVHASYGTLYVNGDAAGYDLIFAKHGLKVYGAWPGIAPGTIVNVSRVDNTGLTIVACKL